jgi:AbrB family looped-hinge helix DNA binding protein
METRISSKGQIVLPKAVRELMKLKTGDVLLLSASENKIILVPKPAEPLQELIKIGKAMPLRNIRRDIKSE